MLKCVIERNPSYSQRVWRPDVGWTPFFESLAAAQAENLWPTSGNDSRKKQG